MTATTSPTVRRIVRSGDADLYVEQRGTGPDVLLLSGLGDTIECWQAQIDALSDRYRITAFDTRGTGRTAAPAESISIPMLAADAATVIEAMGLHDAHVMGFSGAGLVAQELAISYPEAVGSLVLCTTFCEMDELAKRKIDVWLQLAATSSSADEFLRGFLTYVYTREAHEDGRADRWLRELADFEPAMSDEAFVATIEALRSWSTKARLGGIRVPTLVIVGEVDPQFPRPYGEEIASRIGRSELVVMEGQAHQPFQEVPERYNALVTGFWERVAS
ncbi:MAG TPA: alpha/beta hydrolase [Solirubrobacteraceae bacterium]|jgi:pimeloyl-ACP methyl ester carboxylesterase